MIGNPNISTAARRTKRDPRAARLHDRRPLAYSAGVSAAQEPAGVVARPAKERAKRLVADAEVAHKQALRAHRMAPPDAGFRDRLRAMSASAGELRDAYALALQAGLSWRPIRGSESAVPPYELRPGTGRRGPEELWLRFDEAVQRLNVAGAGHSLADVVAGYAAVADAARALADALEAAGE